VNVLPITVGIRDSAVQLVSTLGSVVFSGGERATRLLERARAADDGRVEPAVARPAQRQLHRRDAPLLRQARVALRRPAHGGEEVARLEVGALGVPAWDVSGVSVHCVLWYLLLDYMGWWAPVCCGVSVHCVL
jgi:hypothetical protein